KRIEPGRFEFAQHLGMGQAIQLGNVRHFGRSQRMQFDLRVKLFQLAEKIRIKAESQLGMVSALEQQLFASVTDGFVDLAFIGLDVGDVAFFMARSAKKVAEFAICNADVGGIEVAVNDPGNVRTVFFMNIPECVTGVYQLSGWGV